MPHAVGGNIGTPLVEQVGRLTRADWAVLELSELQLPTINRGADIAVYTNVAADHLDRHGSVAAYRAVKARLAELSAARGTVILNADDPGCTELGARVGGTKRWYGFEDRSLPATIVDAHLYVGGQAVLPVADIPLPGRHMQGNVLAAALAADTAGAAPRAVADGIRRFPGVPHRMELVAEHEGIRYVNDSQATIPMATLAAIGSFGDAGLVLIAGGRGKGLDYAELADAAAARCLAVVVMGETADELERLIGGRATVLRAASMDDAVLMATHAARPGDAVLLSPAAASFDMFTDYAARGDAFRAAVQALRGSGR
jgi:UDP-N-acetylmuramoylalanine--D-glutamate ligase